MATPSNQCVKDPVFIQKYAFIHLISFPGECFLQFLFPAIILFSSCLCDKSINILNIKFTKLENKNMNWRAVFLWSKSSFARYGIIHLWPVLAVTRSKGLKSIYLHIHINNIIISYHKFSCHIPQVLHCCQTFWFAGKLKQRECRHS